MEGRRNYRDAEEMVQALSEFDKNPNTSMVDVAKNHSVGYHALYRRIRGEVDAKAPSGKVPTPKGKACGISSWKWPTLASVTQGCHVPCSG